MADHVVQQVIDAFATTVTGLTTTGTRVYKDRLLNLAASDLPALRIFDDREEIRNEDIIDLPYMQHRTVVLTVEAVAMENSTLDATLNRIRKEVEVAIAGNSRLGTLCKLHCALAGAEKQRDDSCQTAAGKLAMTWHAVVLTMNNAPDVAI